MRSNEIAPINPNDPFGMNETNILKNQFLVRVWICVWSPNFKSVASSFTDIEIQQTLTQEITKSVTFENNRSLLLVFTFYVIILFWAVFDAMTIVPLSISNFLTM